MDMQLLKILCYLMFSFVFVVNVTHNNRLKNWDCWVMVMKGREKVKEQSW